jgi:hypothetical protein
MILEIDIGGGFLPVSCLTDVSENESVELLGTTVRTNGSWKSSRPIGQSKTIDINGLLPVDAALFTWEDLATLKRARTQFAWRIDDDSGVGFISDLVLEGTMGQDVAFSATIVNSGKPIAGPPAGYGVEFFNDPFTGTTFNWRMTNAEIGATYFVEVVSSGGGTPITSSGTVTSETMQFFSQSLAGLNPGELTIALFLTNVNGAGAIVTDTAQYSPATHTVSQNSLLVNLSLNTLSVRVDGINIGDTLDFSVESTGGGIPQTGSLTATADPQNFTVGPITLPDGDLTARVSVNGSGFVPSSNTTPKITTPDDGGLMTDAMAMSIVARQTSDFSATGWSSDGVLNTDYTWEAITGAEVGTPNIWAIKETQLAASGYHGRLRTFGGLNPGDRYTVSFDVKSDNGSGGAGDANFFVLQDAGNIDLEYNNTAWETKSVVVTVRSNGALALYFYPSFGPTAGHIAYWKNLKVTFLSGPAPSGYAASFDDDPIQNNNTSFRITGGNGEGTGYSYAITSSGGGSPLTGSGSITGDPEVVPIDVSSLPNGTLTMNVTVTGPGGSQVISGVTTTKSV